MIKHLLTYSLNGKFKVTISNIIVLIRYNSTLAMDLINQQYQMNYFCRNIFSSLFFIILQTYFSISVLANVSITQPSLNGLCVDGNFETLGDIVITENANNDFKNGPSYIDFVLSSNFKYDLTGISSVSVAVDLISGASEDITISNFYFLSDTRFRVEIDVDPPSSTNHLTISGLRIRGIGSPASGNIVFEGANGDFSGFTSGVTQFASLDSRTFPATQIVSGGGNYCEDGSGLDINLNNSENNISYELYSDGSPTGNILSGTGNPLTYSNQTSTGEYGVKAFYTSDNGCSSDMSGTVSITQEAKIQILAQPADIAECEGEQVQFSVSATGTDLQYQWRNDDGVLGGEISSSFTINSIDYLVHHNQNYQVEISNGPTSVCNGTLNSNLANLQVNVYPEIITHPASITICEGENALFSVDPGNTTSPTFNWQVSADGGISFGNVGVNSNSLNLNNILATADDNLYRVIINGVCSNSMVSNAAKLDVEELAVINSINGPGTICEDETATFNVDASGSNLVFQWYRDNILLTGETSSSLSFTAPYNLNGSEYYVEVDNGSGACDGGGLQVSGTEILSIDHKPEIIQQPVSAPICEGGSHNFTVNAGNTTSPSYQWQISTNSGVSYSNISGGTSSVFTITDATLLENGNLYRVIVSGSCGPTVTSDGAKLTVEQLPVINSVTEAGIVCENANATFQVDASGTSLSYQWYRNGLSISGASSSTYNFTAVSSLNGNLYSVEVSNSSGACTGNIMSSDFGLVVNKKPEITQQPVSATICEGENHTFIVNAGNTTNPAYQWQVSTNNGVNYSNVSGATSSDYTVNAVTLLESGNLYRVIISGSCAPAIISDGAKLTVDQEPLINSVSEAGTVCEDATATYQVDASGTSLAYQWFRDGLSISGATSANYNLTAISSLNGSIYSVEVSNNSGACSGSVMSSDYQLTVNDKPEISQQPVSASICEGGDQSFMVNAGNTTNPTYQWQVSTSNGVSYSNISGATSSGYTVTGATFLENGNLYRVIVSGSCSPSVTSDGAKLTVEQLPVINNIIEAGTVCEDGIASYQVNASGTSLAYQWYQDGNPIGGATNSIYSFTATSGLNGSAYTVEVINSAGACLGSLPVTSPASILTINEKPEITLQPVSASICEGGDQSFTVNTGNTTNSTYQWQVSTNSGVSYSNILGANSSDYTVTGTSLLENGNLYRVVVSGNCSPSVTSDAAELTVEQLPVINNFIEAGTVCEDGIATYQVDASGTSLAYQWYQDANPISGATNAVYSFTATSGLNGSAYTVEVSNGSGMCVGLGSQASPPSILTVNEKPEITQQPLSAIICEGGDQNFTVNAGNTTNPNFQWQVSIDGGQNFSDILGGAEYQDYNTATLSLSGVPSTFNGYQYRVVITGSCGPAFVSNAATLGVNNIPEIISQPLDPSATCENQIASISIDVGQTSGALIQWEERDPAGSAIWAQLINNSVYSGVKSETLSINVKDYHQGYEYRAVVSGFCSPSISSDIASLTVSYQPEIVQSPESQIVCADGDVTFNVDAGPTTAPVYQWQEYNDGTWSSISDNSIYNGTATSSLTLNNIPATFHGRKYRVVVSGSCGPAVISAGANLSVYNLNVNQGTDFTVCEGGFGVLGGSPTATGGAGSYTYVWTGYDDAFGYVSNQANPVVTYNSAGSYRYQVQVTDGFGCASTSTDLVVTVNAGNIAEAGSNQIICQGDPSIQITDASISGGATNAVWTIVNGTGSLGGENSTNPTYFPNLPDEVGTVTLKLTASDLTSCPDVEDFVDIIINRAAIVDAGNNRVICEGSVVNLNGIIGGSATSATWSTAGDGAFSFTGDLNATYTPGPTDISAGSVYLRLTSNDPDNGGPCDVVQDSLLLTINPKPIVNAGSDGVICSGSPINLLGSVGGSSSSATWSVSLGNGTLNATVQSGMDITSIYQHVSSDISNTVIFKITSNDPDGIGPCLAASDEVAYAINRSASVDAGSNQVVCEGSAADLNGILSGSSTSGTWNTTGDGSFSFIGDLNASYQPGPNDIQNGEVKLFLSTNDPDNTGPCSVATDSLLITINRIAVVNAGTDEVICAGSQIDLNAFLNGSASQGNWSVLSGNGVLGSSTMSGQEVKATYSHSPLDIGNSVLFRITTNDPDGAGPCNAVNDEIAFTVNRAATVNAGLNQIICEGSTVELNGAVGGSAASGTWTGGFGNFSFNGDLNAIYTPDPFEYGNSVDLVLRTNDPAGPCPAVVDSMQVQINIAPIVDAGIYNPLCIGDTVDLMGSMSATASAITWSGGAGVFTDINSLISHYVPDEFEAGTNITISITTNDPTGPCPASSDQVSIRVNDLPLVGFSGLDPEYAQNDPDASLTGFPSGGFFSGNGIISNTNVFRPSFAEIGQHTISYYYTDENSCSNVRDQDVIVNAIPVVSFAGLDANFCNDSKEVVLMGDPPGGVFSGDGIVTVGSETKFIPSEAGVGAHVISYTFTDENNATNTENKTVIVNAAPNVDFGFDQSHSCVIDSIQFTNNSSVQFDPFEDEIINYSWTFGGSIDTIIHTQDPKFKYAAPGPYTVNLTATTRYGCSGSVAKGITVGALPEANFDWEDISFGDSTLFTSTSKFPAGFNTDIIDYNWDFGDGISKAGGSLNSIKHVYSIDTFYDVTLKVQSNYGCLDSITKPLFILSYVSEYPYLEDYEDGKNGWVSNGINSSWEIGTPNGNVIKNAYSGINSWITGISKLYNNEEKSYVYSPAFDLSVLERPMLSFMYWNQTERQSDGAVLQYSIDGGRSWDRLGEIDNGISWYNYGPITSSPGVISSSDRNFGNYGWSGKEERWLNARYSLEEFTAEKHIRFRIAFSSNSSTNLDGFAFDDFKVFSRERFVLMEHFTNAALETSNQSNSMVDAIIDQVNPDNQEPREAISVQYQIEFGANLESNPLYNDNPVDPSVRIEYYDFNEPLKTLIDGLVINNADINNIDATDIVARTLVDPAFKIELEIFDTPYNTVEAQATITAQEQFTREIIVHSVVIEKEIVNVFGLPGANSFKYVMRKMLPSAQGTTFSGSWYEGGEQVVPIDWNLDEDYVRLYNPNNLSLILFVQDKITKEIYQTKLVDLPAKDGNPTSVENDLLLEGVSMYPNPVNTELNVQFGESILQEDFQWEIREARGILVGKGQFSAGTVEASISTSHLPTGVHFLIIRNQDNEFSSPLKFVVVR